MPRSRLFIWLLKKGFPLRSVFSRFTRVPLLGRALDYMMFEGDDIIYLPKDDSITINVNQPIERHGDTVVPSDVIKHFIEETDYHVVMNWCICRSLSSCKDHPIDIGCLFLGEAATRIDPNLSRRVTKEEAFEHVEKAREAGLVHLIGRNKLDKVWLNVGPGEKLLTICNCCPCCCLWKVLPFISPSIGSKVQRMPGISVTVTEKCVGCGTCAENICFVNAISIEEGLAVIGSGCRGCGRCVDVCPQGAIEMKMEKTENVVEAISRISKLVDVS